MWKTYIGVSRFVWGRGQVSYLRCHEESAEVDGSVDFQWHRGLKQVVVQLEERNIDRQVPYEIKA